MKRIIFILAALLLLAAPAMAAPQHGDQHDCREDPTIIIIYSDTHGWLWYTGKTPNPEGDQLPSKRLPVNYCPKCGCDPERSRCECDD